MRVLREPTPLNLNDPRLSPLQIAFFWALFAGLVLVPLIRRLAIRPRATDARPTGSGDHHTARTAPEPALGVPDLADNRYTDRADAR